MPRLSETLARLAAGQVASPLQPVAPDRLTDLAGFDGGPGQLRARCHVPAGLKRGAPLVVVLHGCTQSAGGYDHGSGWSTLADRCGFAVLYPEQVQANNANRCFNWFLPDDVARGRGEVASVRAMIDVVASAHALDRSRVFVTGLSAGGAMTMALLATYPETFAGGAVIAGLPYGAAGSVNEALLRMRGTGLPDADVLAERIRRAAPLPPRWPTLSVWHGTADHIVAIANADAMIAAWTALRGLAAGASATDRVDGHERRRWIDADGRAVLSAYRIAGLGHGTPIDPSGPAGLGAAMPFMLAAGIDSTLRIAEDWGIADARAYAAKPPRERTAAPTPPPPPAPPTPPTPPPSPRRPPRAGASGVARAIEDALKAAGVLR